MPIFPRYESKGQLTTQAPSVGAVASTEGQIQENQAKAFGAVSELGFKYAKAMEETKKNVASVNFFDEASKIKLQALEDQIPANESRYQSELDSAFSKHSKGLDGEGLLSLRKDYLSAKYEIAGEFKKKNLAIGEIAIKKALDQISLNPDKDSLTKMQNTLNGGLNNHLLSIESYGKLEQDYTKKIKQNTFLRDANLDPQEAKKRLQSNVYGFDLKEAETAKGILAKNEKRINLQQKTDRMNTEIDQAVLLVNDKLDENGIQNLVLSGQMDADLGGALIIGKYSPDSIPEKNPSVAGQVYIDAVKKLDNFDPEIVGNVLRSAIKDFTKEKPKIDKSDLAFIVKTIEEKRKDPTNPIWGKLRSALEMSTGAAGVVSIFSRLWDFKSDPQPVMKQAIINKDREDNPENANYNVGDIIKRRSGSYEVVGHNEDGKPIFRKK